MKLKKLCLIGLLAGILSVIGCGSDSGSGNGNGGGVDADAECNVELCAEDTDLGRAAKAACINEIESCLTTGTLSEAECIAFGVETCTA